MIAKGLYDTNTMDLVKNVIAWLVHKREPKSFECENAVFIGDPKEFLTKLLNYSKEEIPDHVLGHVNHAMQDLLMSDENMPSLTSQKNIIVAFRSWINSVLAYCQRKKLYKNMEKMIEKLDGEENFFLDTYDNTTFPKLLAIN